MEKVCPRCLQIFKCREDRIDLCSCSKQAKKPGVKEYIRMEYNSCVCAKCLQETDNSFYGFGVNPLYLRKRENN